MPKSQKRWIYAPRKQAPPAVPAALKREVQEKANALVETELKPLHVTPPPEDPQFNYIEDLSTSTTVVVVIQSFSLDADNGNA